MKKLFFTVIALVAINGVSMGKDNLDANLLKFSCKSVFTNTLAYAANLGYSEADQWSMASAAFDLCVYRNQGV